MTSPDELWLDSPDLLDGQDDRGDDREVERLIMALRQPASSEELEGQATTIAAMQAALVQTTRPRRVGHRSRQLGRVAVVKGTVAVGALAFGVAAAAATTGMIEVPRLPGWPHEPAPTDAPAPPTSIGSTPDMDGSSQTGGAASDADGDTGQAPAADETSGAGSASDPSSGPRASIPPTPVPTSPSTSTTEPTTTVPPSAAAPAGPGKANPPPPPVSLPPPAEARPHGPPADADPPPCTQGSSVGDATRDRAATREPQCPPQP